MNNSYGVLGLNGKTIAIIAIVAVMTLVIATLLYIFKRTLTGAIVHVASFTLLMVDLVSWWTISIDWNGDSGGGVIVGSLALLFIWLVGGGLMFLTAHEK